MPQHHCHITAKSPHHGAEGNDSHPFFNYYITLFLILTYMPTVSTVLLYLLNWLAYQCIIIPKAHLMYANQPRNILKNKMCYIIIK